MNYENLNDYELVSLSQEKNEDAVNLLYKKYYPLIMGKAKKIFPYLSNKGVELSDIIQECLIGFEEAIKNFNENDNVTFYTFVNVCIDRQLKTEMKKLDRNKNKILNEAIPLEKLDDSSDNNNLIDYIKDDFANPEFEFLNTHNYCNLLEKINDFLTKLEKKVLLYRLENYSYDEISVILNVNKKVVYNTAQRIREKVEKLIVC